MAQVICEGCKEKILSTETKCPKCDMERPTSEKLSPEKIVIYFVLVALAISVGKAIFSPEHEATVAAAQEIAQEAGQKADQEYEACKRNLSCWAQKNVSSADSYCGTEIEKLASISFRWDGGGAIMKTYKWLDFPSGYVTYTGDNIEIKDRHGVYNNFIFSCDFDPTDHRVMNVRVIPGRL